MSTRIMLIGFALVAGAAWAEHAGDRVAPRGAEASTTDPRAVAEYRQKIQKLRDFLDRLESETKRPPKNYSDRLNYYDINDFTNAVMHDPLFDWAPPVKGLLKRAIESDITGYGALQVLKQTPPKEMTPGMVEAALKFLSKPLSENVSDRQMNETRRLILDGINNPAPPRYSFEGEIRIQIDPAADFENWEPIVNLLGDAKQNLQVPAADALKRSGFSLNPFTKK